MVLLSTLIDLSRESSPGSFGGRQGGVSDEGILPAPALISSRLTLIYTMRAQMW